MFWWISAFVLEHLWNINPWICSWFCTCWTVFIYIWILLKTTFKDQILLLIVHIGDKMYFTHIFKANYVSSLVWLYLVLFNCNYLLVMVMFWYILRVFFNNQKTACFSFWLKKIRFHQVNFLHRLYLEDNKQQINE